MKAAGRIFQLPPSSRSRSSSGSDNSQVRYSGLTRNRAGLSNTDAGMNVTLIGRGGSMPGRNILRRRQVLDQIFRPIAPNNLSCEANVIAAVPADLDVVRYWDLAATEKTELLRGDQDEKRTSIRMRECSRMRDEGRA